MLRDAARSTLAVSRATDNALRQFLVGQGRGRNGEFSRFVEEAVQAGIFGPTADEARQQNAGIPADDIADMVDEALAWARRR